ncbi:sugar phosphate permease [Orbus hercynius]|uniref:Sugar phosphate permease n=1 Tax=Orbus hercynius TaxID=593135 RepID=A0A495RE25_9GAMM|nr:MFS transporter [Orbus hercynius]RKS85732.1 sugar phosphate permease [Orbus hercynius]
MKIEKKYMMILLLFIGYLVVYIDKTVIGLAMIDISRELELSTQDVGYITGLFFLSYSLFQIPAGWLNDRIGYKKVLLLSLVTISACAFLFGFVGSTIALLIAFRFLAGVGHSGYPCSCAKAVSANFAVDERTLAQSILLSSAGVAMIVGPIVVSYTVSTIGWRWTYVDLAVIALLVALFIVLWVPSAKKGQSIHAADSVKISYISLLKNPVVILLFVAIFGVNIPAYGLMVWLPKYLVQVRGLNLEWAAYVMAVGGVAQWLSSIGSGWFVGKYMRNKEKSVIFVSSMISALSIWLVYVSPNIIVSAVFLFIAYIFLMTSFVTIFTLPMKWLPSNVIGSAMGLVNTGGTLGGFVSPIVIGFMISTQNNAMSGDFSFAFMFLAAGMVLAGLIVLPLKKPHA